LQLIAMIGAARKELAAERRPVGSRVLIVGFSAGGMFTNRFAVLHPKQVLAAAVGAPGWPIAPVAVYQGEPLRYPIGIGADTNDPLPCRDNFSAADEKLINRLFGQSGVVKCGGEPGKTVDRWWGPAERLYQTAGLKRAQFERPYPGVKHEVVPDMRNAIPTRGACRPCHLLGRR
jgi:pimeloyl-ACP methyl ester carboxylesterase